LLETACRPWQANVVFFPIAPANSRPSPNGPGENCGDPEADALGQGVTRFATETRAVATDERARKEVWRYWRKLARESVLNSSRLLPAVRRQAESVFGEPVSGSGRPERL